MILQMKAVQRPIFAPFECCDRLCADERGEARVGDLRILCQSQNHLGTLHLNVRCLVTRRQSACLFELFGCKGWLIFRCGARRK